MYTVHTHDGLSDPKHTSRKQLARSNVGDDITSIQDTTTLPHLCGDSCAVNEAFERVCIQGDSWLFSIEDSVLYSLHLLVGLSEGILAYQRLRADNTSASQKRGRRKHTHEVERERERDGQLVLSANSQGLAAAKS